MPSTLTTDATRPSRRVVADLLVLWQHPDSREIIPIGRFARSDSGYQFRYTNAVTEIADFRPLPGFPELHRAYVSERLPALFAQRVMNRERPDFDDYMRALGLDPEMASPWEQIVQSGGRREGDTLQFMEVPVAAEGLAIARFFVNGIRHVPDGTNRMINGRSLAVSPEDHERALQTLEAGQELFAEREEGNPEDDRAMVVTRNQVPLGWVPRALSASVRELSADRPIPLTVVRVAGPQSPSHQRLAVELRQAVPDDFRFDRDGRWQPVD